MRTGTILAAAALSAVGVLLGGLTASGTFAQPSKGVPILLDDAGFGQSAVPLGSAVGATTPPLRGGRSIETRRPASSSTRRQEPLATSAGSLPTPAIVGTGGFLDLDRHDVAIPAGQLKIDGDKLLPEATNEVLKVLPKFEYAK